MMTTTQMRRRRREALGNALLVVLVVVGAIAYGVDLANRTEQRLATRARAAAR
jgi:hypothetical protein